MSAVSYPHSTPRLSVARALGAAESDAHRVEADVLERLRSATRRAHKAVTLHSRQTWEKQLSGERGLRLADLAYALAAFGPSDRALILQPLLAVEETSSASVLQELAEATEATGKALGFVQRVLAGGPCTPNDIQRINAEIHAAQRELADVPAAMRRGL